MTSRGREGRRELKEDRRRGCNVGCGGMEEVRQEEGGKGKMEDRKERREEVNEEGGGE